MAVAGLLVAFVALLAAALVFRHFLPLLRNPGAPSGSFGWPLVGETLGFLRPHASNTSGVIVAHDDDHASVVADAVRVLAGVQVRRGVSVAPVRRADGGVVRRGAQINHLVLQNEERLFRCSYPGPVRGILGGSSLLVVTGERHCRMRGVALALVASAGAGLRPAFLAGVDRAARAAVASWRGRRAVAFCPEARQVKSQRQLARRRYMRSIARASRSVAGQDREPRCSRSCACFVRTRPGSFFSSFLPQRVHGPWALFALGMTLACVFGTCTQFAFGVIVEQVLGLSPDEPVAERILEDYSTFMKGLVSLPLNIPGTPYARAVEVMNFVVVRDASYIYFGSLD